MLESDSKSVETHIFDLHYSGNRLYGMPRDRVFLSTISAVSCLISVVQLTGPGRPGDRNMGAI